MFSKVTSTTEAKCLLSDTEAPFQSGDRILVLFGDTPILGTIYSANCLAGGKVVAWNVMTDASGQTYPVHEGFLRHALEAVS